MGPDVLRLMMSTRVTRLNGMRVCCYLVGSILVDTGLSHAKSMVLSALEGRKIDLVACTHHHEDHTGNAAAVSREHGCPVYMHDARAHLTEGIVDMLAYRRWFWGEVEPFSPLELPCRLASGGRTLVGVPIPGHSATHVAYHEPETGIVFTGDLYITGGVTAVMSHENPYESIRSLRRIADLKPTRMLTGHGLTIENPATILDDKADRIEQAARRVIELHRLGLPDTIILHRVFRSGHARDRALMLLTRGEFSRLNFVRACIRHTPDRA